MPADRKERLDAHGFVWGVLAAQWEKGFKQLQTFGRENGHCRVPAKYVTAEGYRLGQWVSVQRVGKDSMPAERKARLDALGFVWTSKVNERRPAAE